jgi:hypothetical protein
MVKSRSRRRLSEAALGLVLAIVLAAPGTAVLAASSNAGGPSRADVADAITAFFSERTSHLVAGAKGAKVPRIASTARLQRSAGEFGAVLDSRRESLKKHGEEYTAASTTISITSVRQAGDQLTVTASELTKLNYKQVRGDEPPFTAYRLDHILTFVRANGAWRLAAQRPASPDSVMPITERITLASDTATVDPNSSAIDRAPGRLPADGKAGTAQQPGGSGTSPMAIPCCLNYTSMVNYAYKYWDNYNTAYRNFAANGGGGDCTNFISQALRAGGWQDKLGLWFDDNNWWYNSSNQTHSWAGAENWSHFAPQRTTALSNIWYMALADVLQFDFNKDGTMDHTMIVTKKTSTEIYMTYHTVDHVDRTLSSLQAVYANSAWWYSYRT